MVMEVKRIVIVGNGKKALNSKKKEFIDSSSIVIRMNNFKIEGYEEYVGTKTDVYSCAPKYLKFIDTTDEWKSTDTERRYFYLKLAADCEGKYTDEELAEMKKEYHRIYKATVIDTSKLKEIFYLWTTDKSAVESYSFHDKIKVWDFDGFDPVYSTGLRTILYCLHHYKDHEIFITGFDYFLLSGWYWDDEKYKLADKYIRTANYTDGHPYLLERDMVQNLLKNRLITEI